MTLPRLGLAAAALLGWLVEPAPTYACSGYMCQHDQFLPRAGSVPANIAAIAWSPGFDQRDEAEASGSAPKLPRFECTSATGATREVSFVALPEGDPDHLALSEPLIAGERCTITSGVTDCMETDAAYLDGRAEFDVVASRPLPDDLGLVSLTWPMVGYADVAADSSCSERVEVCASNTSLVFSAAALPWKDALLFETLVDGQVFSTTRDVAVPNELGGLYRGRDRDFVYVAIGELPDNVQGGDDLGPGQHSLAVRARLPGSDALLETPPVDMPLDCKELGSVPTAQSVMGGSSDGCTVAHGLGRSARQLPYSALGFALGLLVIIGRRARRG